MIEKISITIGRLLVGFYFVLPGLRKIPDYDMMLSYMALHNIPMANILLPITILLQIGCGSMLMIGYRIKETALILAALTLLINFGMHDFWNVYPNTDAGHELQNFVKNLAIFAGILVLSASNSVNQWRLFGKKS